LFQASMRPECSRCQWRSLVFSTGVLLVRGWTRWRHLHRSHWPQQTGHDIFPSQQLPRVRVSRWLSVSDAIQQLTTRSWRVLAVKRWSRST